MNSSTAQSRAWSVESFARFWDNPAPKVALVPMALTEDIVGYWAGRDEPVHGPEAYTGCIEALTRALPDVRVEVAEHASSDDMVFIRWIMSGTGRHGRFELSGVDRVRLRGGLVAENIVTFDTAAFERRTGIAVPWVSVPTPGPAR
jgi:hypothetical protein